MSSVILGGFLFVFFWSAVLPRLDFSPPLPPPTTPAHPRSPPRSHLSDRRSNYLVGRALTRDVPLLLALVARLGPDRRAHAWRGRARAREVVQLAALVAAHDAGRSAGEAAASADEAAAGREGDGRASGEGHAGGANGAGRDAEGERARRDGRAAEREGRERVLEDAGGGDGRAQAGDVAKVACQGMRGRNELMRGRKLCSRCGTEMTGLPQA